MTTGDKSTSAIHALCLLLLRLRIIEINTKEGGKGGGSGIEVVLRLGRMNDSMAIVSDMVWASVPTFDEESEGGGGGEG